MKLPAYFLRPLKPEEEEQFRQWARERWAAWPPAIRDEIKQIVTAEQQERERV
jgi:hypothetical protein